MFQGRSADAMRVGRKISVGLEPQMIAGPFSETFQHLMSQPLYVMVRFGEWDTILKEPQPAADLRHDRLQLRGGPCGFLGQTGRRTGQYGHRRQRFHEGSAIHMVLLSSE
jgi:hypothetical protein